MPIFIKKKMPRYHPNCEEEIRKLMLLKNSDCHKALYESYCPLVYGQFSTFCRDHAKAYELTEKVFEIAKAELENNRLIKGKLLVWLLNIARKVSRDYLLDYSVKKSDDNRCIKRLVLSEGFSTQEAAGILGISMQEAIFSLRQQLKE
ncbi:hypothetical protein [Pedobacter sp. AJM]|uniref:hypothetical protein n=2 Tax=Pedobacter TaxID=84567 RepID=UPI00112512C5|nr:hypothetical protein [Pedobacter sp. AJM]